MSNGNQNRSAILPHLKAHPMTITTSALPTPVGSEVLIRVRAVAINPADWAVQTLGVVVKPEFYPYVNGCDVSGEVVSVGPTQQRFRVGDRVTALATAFRSGDTRCGAFQEYMIGTEPFMAKIPDHVEFREAAVLPLCLSTSSAMLFSSELMGFNLPRAGVPVNSKAEVVLVWGGSSSIGCNAIQALKAAGYIVAATASESNHTLLRDMGVDYVFDHRSEGVVDSIVKALESAGKLAGVYNAIITEDTTRACAEIASRVDGRKQVGTVLAPGMPTPQDLPEDVRILVDTVGQMNQPELGKSIWAEWLSGALKDGSMKCRPYPEVCGAGLEKIQVAVDAIRNGVSGKKLVVEL
ncbi:chaperonin 10-like protein [Pestalotiopsis sp. NC0098]|nr:chaperonin 10-like protein [Pestalotiopsis sp. NC0098]